MPVLFFPESCVWSPDPIAGPNTERVDVAIDTDEPDGGASNGRLTRNLRTNDGGQTLSGPVTHGVRGVELPPQASEKASLAIALALWRNPPGNQGGGGQP